MNNDLERKEQTDFRIRHNLPLPLLALVFGLLIAGAFLLLQNKDSVNSQLSRLGQMIRSGKLFTPTENVNKGDTNNISPKSTTTSATSAANDKTTTIQDLIVQGALSVNGASTLQKLDGTDATFSSLTISNGPVNLPYGSISNTALANSSLSFVAGSGLTGGGAVPLGGSATLNIGAGTGIGVDDNSIKVLYGSTDSTAVRGDQTIGLSAGTNLTGGGVLTLGSGGTLSIGSVSNPYFSTSVTTPLLNLTNSGFTTAFQTATLSGNQTINLPNASGDVCLTTGNCAGLGGTISGSGTTNRIAKFTSAGGIGNSSINDLSSAVAMTIDASGNVGIGTTSPSTTLEVNGAIRGAIQDNGGQVFNVKAYGAVGDGTTDDSTAVQNAINAAGNANGGTVYFPAGTYRINSQITFVNDGATPPKQKSIRLSGVGPSHSGSGAAPNGGTILDLRYSGSDAKILTLGHGFLEIDHLSLKESSNTTTTPFILTTNTTLNIHEVEAFGSASKSGTLPDQDFIILGGTSTTIDGSVNAPFQGYGTVIANNYMNHLRRFVYGRTYANGIQIVNNTIWTGAGSNLAGGAAIEFSGDAGSGDDGNYISGNLLEMQGYPYGMKVTNGLQNSFIANNFYDPAPSIVLAFYRFESSATYNLVIDGFRDDSKPLISDASGGTNSAMTAHQSQTTTWAQPWAFTNTLTIQGGANPAGPYLKNTSGDQYYNQMIGANLNIDYLPSGGSVETVGQFLRASSTDKRLALYGTTNSQIYAPSSQLELTAATGQGLFLGDAASPLQLYYLNGVFNSRTAGTAYKLTNTGSIEWSSTTLPGGASDLGITRNSAGVLEINNGTVGSYRDLQLRALNPSSGNLGIGTTSPSTKLDITGLTLDGSQADNTVGSLKTSASVTVSSGTHTYSSVQFKPTINTAGGTTTLNVLNIDTTNTSTTGTTTNLIKASYGGVQKFLVDSSGNITVNSCTGCGGGGSVTWSTIADPSGNLALNMGANTSTFTYNAATGAGANLFNLTDTTSNTGTGYLLNLTTATGSTLKPFHVSSAGTEAITVLANGNVGIGTTGPLAKLQVTNAGETLFNLSNSSSSSNGNWGITVGSGTQHANGYFVIGPGTGSPLVANKVLTLIAGGQIIIGNATNSILGMAAGTLDIHPNSAIANNLLQILTNDQGNLTATSSVQNILTMGLAFAPTSGTAQFNSLQLAPTINQTGGANGVTRGLYINPTVTAAADFRALETVRGNVIFGSTSGNVGIGDTSPTNKLKVVGSLCVSSATGACASSVAGTIYASNTTVQSADLAENYVSSQTLEPGDLVIPADDGNNQAVVKSTKPNQQQLIGVVSTKPGVTLNSDAAPDTTHPNLYPLALSGRVPVKVTTENGPIQTGDYLTSSTTPGVAMKATHPGQIIGKALEPFSDNGVGKIMTYVNVSYADPQSVLANLTLDDNGNLVLPSSTVIASETKQSLSNDPTATAMPTNGSTFDASQFSDQVATSAAFTDLTSKTESLKTKVASLEASLTLLTANPNTTASSSAELGLENLETTNATLSGTLSVAGRTLLSDVGVTGKITSGLLTIDGLDPNGAATINTTSGALKLQSDGTNGLDILDGKVTIATNGDMKVQGEITAKKFNIDTPDVASASIGEGLIKSGQNTVEIKTKSVTDKSKVFVTATSDTDYPLIVVQKKAGESFSVKVKLPVSADVKFDWWIVN